MAANNLFKIYTDRRQDPYEYWISEVGDLITNPDPLLKSKSAGNLCLYEQAATDDQVQSCYQQRFKALVRRSWRVEPGGSRAIDVRAAKDLESQLQAINWDDRCEKMLWGNYYGYSVAEMEYRRDGDRVTLADIHVRDRKRFAFDRERRLRMGLARSTKENQILPDRKFWYFCTGADNTDNPYGVGQAHYLYWLVYFKRMGFKWWGKHNERFGEPARVGKYPKTATTEDKNTLWNALGGFGQDGRMMIPDTVQVELVEASRTGSDYEAFHRIIDAAIAKIILSQTMTTDNGSSLSQAQVHQDVAGDVIAADADLLSASFNAGPAKWLTEWNFPRAAAPRVVRIFDEAPDLIKLAQVAQTLNGLGFEPTEEWIKATFGDGFKKIDYSDPSLEPTNQQEPIPAEIA